MHFPKRNKGHDLAGRTNDTLVYSDDTLEEVESIQIRGCKRCQCRIEVPVQQRPYHIVRVGMMDGRWNLDLLRRDLRLLCRYIYT